MNVMMALLERGAATEAKDMVCTNQARAFFRPSAPASSHPGARARWPRHDGQRLCDATHVGGRCYGWGLKSAVSSLVVGAGSSQHGGREDFVQRYGVFAQRNPDQHAL